MFSLQGKTALITGAAKGIGFAVAQRFRAAGAEVIITDISDAAETAGAIGARFLRLDVSREQEVAGCFEELAAQQSLLDIVVNNAGIVPGDNFVLTEAGRDDSLRGVFEVNTYGVFYGLKHAPSCMRDFGSIINTSSLAAHLAVPGNSQYSASKAAVAQFTRTSAVELGPRGIRVNAVCPSFIRTDMGGGELGENMSAELTALGRIGEVEDLVGLYHFLAADESRFISGQVFNVDGGWTAGVSMGLMSRYQEFE